jgi:hypothetical protein
MNIHSEGNFLSILVFFLWVPFALWGARRWPPAKGAALLLLLPVMFLPERVEFRISGVPPLGKNEIAIFWILVGILLYHRTRFSARPKSGWIGVWIGVLLVGQVATVFANTDPLTRGAKYLYGHGAYDAVRLLVDTSLDYVAPFVIGAAMFRSSKDLQILFKVLLGATLVYGILQLIEVRLSPQLNNWVYGFFQHSFMQMRRQGGFRPIVFMAHGLTVAMFTAAGLMAAATLLKANLRLGRFKPKWALPYLGFVAILNKSVAAFLYALTAVPLILFTSPKTQFRVAALLAAIVLAYPTLRHSDILPVYDIRDALAAQFGEDRAASLTTRLVNEESILERALDRPMLGWGAYGRSYDYNLKTGKQLTIPDGDWVNTIGMYGFVGFYGKYLLMLWPIFMVARRLRTIPRPTDRILLAGLALILAFSAADHIPNSSAHYLPFVFSGALFGTSTGIAQAAVQQRRRRRQQTVAERAAAAPAAA